MNAISFGADGMMTGAACWRADGTPVGIAGGLARAGVRFSDLIAPDRRRLSPPMTHTSSLLDVMHAARAERLRAFLPPGFVLTHGTERGRRAMKAIIRDADFAISAQVAVSGEVLRGGDDA